MSKIKSFIKFFNPALLLLMGYVVKIGVFNPSYQDAIVVGILTVAYLGQMFFSTKQAVITENAFRQQVNNDIGDLKGKISGISLNNQGRFLQGK